MQLKIISPSKGRFDGVLTRNVIDDLIIACPENEVKLYKEFNEDNEVIGVPKDIKGIVATRQWILNEYDNVFMVDDDVEYVRRMYTEENEPYKINNPQMVKDLIYQLADMANSIGSKMFGFGNIRRPEHFTSHRIFRMSGYQNASYCGYLKGHGLKYDLDLVEGEDHYMSCLNVFKNRYMLIDNRFAFYTKDNFKAKGGCCDYRTLEDMKETTLALREDFGDVIKIKKATNGKMAINEGERSLKFPF